MRVFVVGGTHFIGPWVVQQLASAGQSVAVFHRGITEHPALLRVPHFHGDRSDQETLTASVHEWNPDIVIDMVAGSERHAQILLESVRGVARRVVVASSMDVYQAYGRIHGTEPGPIQPTPLTEGSALRSVWYPYRNESEGENDPLYHYEKILVERTIMNDSTVLGTVLRFPMVYGPRDYQHRLFPYLKRMVVDRRPVIVLDPPGSAWRASRAYVANVAHAVVLAVTNEQARGHLYHVSDIAYSEWEWVQRIAHVVGYAGRIVIVPTDASSASPPQDWTLDPSRIRAELGYHARVAVDDGLEATIAWELANPPTVINPADFNYPAEDARWASAQEISDQAEISCALTRRHCT